MKIVSCFLDNQVLFSFLILMVDLMVFTDGTLFNLTLRKHREYNTRQNRMKVSIFHTSKK